MLRSTIISFLLIFSLYTNCQSPSRCASVPQVPLELIEIVQNRSAEVIIPVVFHSVYQNSNQIINESDIRAQLNLVNAAFSQTLEISDQVPLPVRPTVGSVGFRFELAELDPNGSPSDGILQVGTNLQGIGDRSSSSGISAIKLADEGGSQFWDTDQYLNIWLGERSASLGYTVTDNSTSVDIQGIVLDFREAQDNTKTIIHEIGHYFGLLHPWGNLTGCDDEDDGITDTPFQFGPNFSCIKEFNCGNTVHSGNYMDFSNDNCLNHFTKLQADYMQQFASMFKADLLNSLDCFVKNIPSDDDFEVIYSNQAINIYLAEALDNSTLYLFSMGGSLIQQRSVKSENYIKLQTDGIPFGTYVLVVESQGTLFSSKVLIY